MSSYDVRAKLVVKKELQQTRQEIKWIRKDLAYYQSEGSCVKPWAIVEELQALLRVKHEHGRALLAQLRQL